MQAAAFLAVTILLASGTRATEMNMSSQSTEKIKCNESVTLHCRLSQNKVIKLEILNLATNSSKVLCTSMTKESNNSSCKYIQDQDLALTIEARVNSTYICKEQNNLDHRHKMFNLLVTGCNSSKINLPDRWMSALVSLTMLLLVIVESVI